MFVKKKMVWSKHTPQQDQLCITDYSALSFPDVVAEVISSFFSSLFSKTV